MLEAGRVCAGFLRGELPDAALYSAFSASLPPLDPVGPAPAANAEWRKMRCEPCDRLLDGQHEWEAHLKSKKHRTAVKRRRRREAGMGQPPAGGAGDAKRARVDPRGGGAEQGAQAKPAERTEPDGQAAATGSTHGGGEADGPEGGQ